MNSDAEQISSPSPLYLQCDDITFTFGSQTLSRVPRAWDREPKAPFAPTTKRRIVWKRYGLRSTALGDAKSTPLELEASEAAMRPRDVKRLCVNRNCALQTLVQPHKQTQYLATLQDKVLGTPRRKAAQQKNLRHKSPNKSIPANVSFDISFVVDEEEVAETQEQHEGLKEGVAEISSNDETQTSRLLHHSRHDNESPGLASSVETKRSVDVRLLENSTATHNHEEQSVGTETIIDITKLGGNQSSEVLVQELQSISMGPAVGENILNGVHTTLDAVQSRGRSNMVDLQSEISRDAGDVSECLEGPLPPTAAPLSLTSLVEILTEARVHGEDETFDLIATQLKAQECESPIIQARIPEALGTEETMSPDLHSSLPMRRTRSGARFSDETNMLKDFLIRAHAKKATKSKELDPISFVGGESPRRSPRKVLGHLDKNSPSHTQSQDLSCSLNTPLDNDSLDLMNSNDGNEKLHEESKLRRRSARSCMIMPEKTALGPLCFIPVRRLEGSGPVVLQKWAAQELAITTRANTRHNKGLSKLPKFMLETLTTAVIEDTPVKTREIRAAKSVDWDKNLVYFEQPRDRKVGKKKKEGKVEVGRGAKSFKELGDISGIPAPKSVVGKANPPNGTPAPKRRGKRES
ncbi:hypothetical protein MMC26_000167 [Xylographa opegraphella]|nr:hypothetical protein [Xylographa opegraphella]